jgi:hypothetical protein
VLVGLGASGIVDDLAVAPLAELLSDDEEKTRANAAGALGNLVRNSGQLCGEVSGVPSCFAVRALRGRVDTGA